MKKNQHMEKKLSRKQILVVASTLFGMFFGAGNLIFRQNRQISPVTLSA